MGLISKIIGTYSQRQIKKITPLCDKIESLDTKYSAMSDSELRAMTDSFKRSLAEGSSLNDILPDAFAVVREAAWRTLGKKPYYVQLIGGIIIHQGRISEMKTGEGKTLTETLPAYLNALTGNGVHIVTVNDYLARRDSEWMGKIYNFLGMSVGLIVHGLSNEERKKAYKADITYGTNNELGFDYLRDNMVTYKEQMVQRGHHFAIVDEVDSILIDEARTPLIISGRGEKSTDLYEKADKFVKKLKCFTIKEIDEKASYEDIAEDYIIDEKARTAVLTAKGIKKAEEFFSVENLSDEENTTLNHHINQALKAVGVMKRDVDYVVKDNAVTIVDTFTGRLMFGRRYSDGLHQAIEAKERVKIEHESKTLATITFQNYFRLYKKLSGMTGTALTEENEFRDIYNIDVVEIPTNKPMVRADHTDSVYRNEAGKYKAIIEQIRFCHEKGQPVLVGTVSVDKSEYLAGMLKKQGIPHNVLNAKYHEKEAEIIAQAGGVGAVTISTNMAGRGTDIVLGGNTEFLAKTKLRKEGADEELIRAADSAAETDDEAILTIRARYRELIQQYEAELAPETARVKAAGGLFVLGTERHESRRIDNQLRGRSGRQGDAGESKFFLSLEDDLLRLFGSDRVAGVVSRLGLEEDQAINAKILSNTIENAQKRLEGNNFERRKNVLKYDDVMNQQRTIIYSQRREVLDGGNIKDKIVKMIEDSIDTGVDTYCTGDDPAQWNLSALRSHFLGYLTSINDFTYDEGQLEKLDADDIKTMLKDRAAEIYKRKEEMFGDDIREVERIILLRSVDEKWMEHIDAMSGLMGSVSLHAYAQRDPIVEYRMTGAQMFDEMVLEIRESTVRGILGVVRQKSAPLERKQVAKAQIESLGGASAPQKPSPVKKAQKVGRNDPCLCGSGKKYKKCCGFNSAAED